MWTRSARLKQHDGWTGDAANAAFSVDASPPPGRIGVRSAPLLELDTRRRLEWANETVPVREPDWSYQAGSEPAALCSVYPDMIACDLMAVAAQVAAGIVLSVAASPLPQDESSVWRLDAGRAVNFQATVGAGAGIRENELPAVSAGGGFRPAVAGGMGIGRRICIWNQRFNL